MVTKIKPANHHWWPESLSKFWADDSGHVHCVNDQGELVRSLPKNFGSIKNANHVLLGKEPSVWDSSFENTFDRADNAFPGIIEWLQTLSSPLPPSLDPMAKRLTPVIFEAERRDLLAECLASLIGRSPNFRNRIRLTSEHYRKQFGMPDPTADKNLIALNVRGTQKVFSEVLRKGGKFVVLLSGEEEFIFGDGFLHSFSSADRPMSARCLIPLTPEIAVFYTYPSRYRSYPQAFVMNLKASEVSLVNWLVQAYSKRFLFFREIHPVIDDAFSQGEHLETSYHQHPWIEDLQAAMANTFFGVDKEFYPQGKP